MAEAPGGMCLRGRTRVFTALVMPPPRIMSTLAISMIASVAGSVDDADQPLCFLVGRR
jgi:hypothetical protein